MQAFPERCEHRIGIPVPGPDHPGFEEQTCRETLHLDARSAQGRLHLGIDGTLRAAITAIPNHCSRTDLADDVHHLGRRGTMPQYQWDSMVS